MSHPAPIPPGQAAPQFDVRRVRVLEGQNRVLEAIARGAPLDSALQEVARTAESVMSDAICVIRLMEPRAEGLRLAAAPSLSREVRRQRGHLPLRPSREPCAAAVCRREPVIVPDIADYWDMNGQPQSPLPHGCRACWSQPILDTNGAALGALSLYFPEPRSPEKDDYRVIDSLIPLARLAVEHDRRDRALRSADERLASIAASIPGVVYQRVVRPNGDIRYTYISDSARELFGVSPEEIVANPSALFDCHGPEYSQTFRQRLLAASRDMTMWDVEAEIISRTGERKWTHAIARPKREPDGSVYWNGVILDATRLKQANLELAAANRSKSEFLANISHELRTPLNAIIGFSELMLSTIDNGRNFDIEKFREYTNDIRDSGRHLLCIINDVLDVAKIEAGKVALHEEFLDPGTVIATCIRLIQSKADDGNLMIRVETSPNMPRLRADERKIKQILTNLLSNAVKFTPAHGKITVTARIEFDGHLSISVADTGVGIAPEYMELVLSPFAQADSGLDRRFEGTGLGLPLSKAMTELHGGTLELRSSLGIGTTVTVHFPAERLCPVEDEPVEGEQARATGTA